MNPTIEEYYTQYEILSTFRIKEGTEILRLKMLLYNKFLKYPKYVCCKVMKNDSLAVSEAKNMKKICENPDEGLIKYYYHIVSEDTVSIFIEDCFKYSSGYHQVWSLNKNRKLNEGKAYNIYMKSKFFKIVGRLIKSLKKIHSLGFIHSDIAPKNILISKDKIYKIADFGSLVKKKNGYIVSYSENYLPKNERNHLNNNQSVMASESIDYFALGKSIFEILTLNNGIDFTMIDENISEIKYIYNKIKSVGLDKIYSDAIRDIMNKSYKNETYYKRTQELRNTVTLLSLQITVGYCCECKMSIVDDDNKELSIHIGKSIIFECKHSFHIKCLENERIFKCKVCFRYIGSEAYEILKSIR